MQSSLPKLVPSGQMAVNRNWVYLSMHRSTNNNNSSRVLVTAAAADAQQQNGKAKRPTIAELKAKVESLQEENKRLRAALAAIQGFEGGYESDDDLPGTLIMRTANSASAPIRDTQSRVVRECLESDGEAGSLTNATRSETYKADDVDFENIIEQLNRGILWPKPGESPPFYTRPSRDNFISVPSPDDDAYFYNYTQNTNTSNLTATNSSSIRSLSIIHVAAEMAPSAKVGGLGDVVTGLSKALVEQGHDVTVILPFYECLPVSAIENLEFHTSFECPKGRVQDGVMQLFSLKTNVWTGSIEGVPVVLIRPDWEATGSNLFRGNRIYGGSYNEAEAYLYFCRAALEYIRQSGRRPDVIHSHDWQAAAVPMLFWDFFSNSMPSTRPALTIHNFDSSGECRQDEFAATGVSGEVYADVNKALDERTIGHNPERLCLLKGGIVYSSLVTTVSPNYSEETLKGGAAGWLRSTLARPEVADKYWGVLNGIDTQMWNPAQDTLLPACFSSSMPQGKALCKKFLQEGFGMDVNPDKPLVAVISRLVPQKGIHLIEHAVGKTVSMGGQFVLLGTGHADGGLRRMAGDTFRDHPDVRMIFEYSESLAHLIYAAADIFLVPSMFEPCGLTQMIALRYGGVPVVRKTGGLADTIKDVDTSSGGGNSGNGFVFEGIDGGALDSALVRAMQMYVDRKDAWTALQINNMRHGAKWSWKVPAQSYVELYSGVLG